MSNEKKLDELLLDFEMLVADRAVIVSARLGYVYATRDRTPMANLRRQEIIELFRELTLSSVKEAVETELLEAAESLFRQENQRTGLTRFFLHTNRGVREFYFDESDKMQELENED